MAEKAGYLSHEQRHLPQLAISFFRDMESENEAEDAPQNAPQPIVPEPEDAPQPAAGPLEADEVEENDWQNEVPSTEIVCLCLPQLSLRLSWHSAVTPESRLCVSHCSVLSHVIRALFVRPLLGYAWLCLLCFTLYCSGL